MARVKKEKLDPWNKCSNCGAAIKDPTPAGKPSKGYVDSVYAKIDHGHPYSRRDRCVNCGAWIKTYHYTKNTKYINESGGDRDGYHDPNFRY